MTDATIMDLRTRIAELEKWYDLLSDGGWINVGDTPEEGIESLRVLIESPKNTAELEAKLDRVRPYLKHKRTCPQPTDITLDEIGIDTSCTCGLSMLMGKENEDVETVM